MHCEIRFADRFRADIANRGGALSATKCYAAGEMEKLVMSKRLISLVLCVLMLASVFMTSCSKEEIELNIIDDKYRNWYEIFVHSFYDTNNDGIGDLNGVTEVIIRFEDKELIIDNPSVSLMNVMGQETYQVEGKAREVELEYEIEIPDEDIYLLMIIHLLNRVFIIPCYYCPFKISSLSQSGN